MKRLTMDNPETMTESTHNMVFIKNNEVYLRGIGEEEMDISLVEYCRNACKDECDKSYDSAWNAEAFGELMDCDCSISKFYYMCTGFADVRQRLIKYEDAEEPKEMDCLGCTDSIYRIKCKNCGVDWNKLRKGGL